VDPFGESIEKQSLARRLSGLDIRFPKAARKTVLTLPIQFEAN
jgi:hypothetical protein